MANEVDLQRLVVQLEASFVKYERQWSRAMGITDANVRRTQKQFDGLAKTVGGSAHGAGDGMNYLSMQTSNIAAQFQDIAVQLQAGQSPFTIALQQGTQLSQALGTGRGLRGTVTALGGALASLISPVSLATIAIIGLGGAAVQYFMTLLEDGRASEEELKKQEEVLRDIADRWGELVPFVREYVEARDRATEKKEQADAFAGEIRRGWDEAGKAADHANDVFVSVMNGLSRGTNAGREEVIQFGNAYNDLSGSVEAGNATTEQAARVSAALADVMKISSIPQLAEMKTAVDALAASLAIATQQQQIFTDAQETLTPENITSAFVDEQARLNSLTSEQLELENEISRVKSEADRAGAVLTELQALDIARRRLAAEERRSQLKADTKASVKDDREAERERDAIVDLIAALEFEYSQLGLTAQQQAVANELRRAGAYATEEQRARITELVNATFEEQRAIDAANDAMQEFADISKSALQGFISDMLSGKSAAESLASALGNIGNKLLDIGLDSLFSGLSGGAGGGGNIFSTLFGKRAAGGPVTAGQPYLVGERGPEIVVPGRSGYVVPNHRLGGGGSGGLSLSLNFNGGPPDSVTMQDLRNWSRFELPKIIRHHQSSTIPLNG